MPPTPTTQDINFQGLGLSTPQPPIKGELCVMIFCLRFLCNSPALPSHFPLNSLALPSHFPRHLDMELQRAFASNGFEGEAETFWKPSGA